jgi:hypothetical protein
MVVILGVQPRDVMARVMYLGSMPLTGGQSLIYL